MSITMDWESDRFKVWAELDLDGTVVCLDVVSFSSEFELNAIPTAVIQVGVGRKAHDVRQVAKIHEIISRMRLQLPIRIFCSAVGLDGLNRRSFWPKDPFKIFDGYAQGTGFRRNTGGADFSIFCIHWLADLNFSSSLSEISHPLNPSMFFFNASAQADVAGSGGSNPILVAGQYPFEFVNTTTVYKDFWGAALKPWFLAVSGRNRINVTEIQKLTGGVDTFPERNVDAAKALNRFEPQGTYVLGVPLRLRPDSGDPDGEHRNRIADAISRNIGYEGQEGYVNSTLWDKIAGQLRSYYMFAVVPLVDKALVVPFTPTNNGTDPHRVIGVKDYESIELQAAMPRPLRAVGLLVELGMQNGSNTDRTPTWKGFGGYFDKFAVSPDKKEYERGLILFKNAPKWLAGINDFVRFSPGAAGVPPGTTIRTAASPSAGDPLTQDSPRTALAFAKGIWNDFAKAYYIHEALKGRQGVISGRVRFDIAPGSTLKIEAAQDKFSGKDCGEEHFFCEVLRVSTILDGERNRGSTSFHLSFLRSEKENSEPGTSAFNHPLYAACRWGGCVMVEVPEFGKQTTQSCTASAASN